MTVARRSLLPWWIVWSSGVAIVPFASVLVPRDGSLYPIVPLVPDPARLLVCASWSVAFGLMFVGMLGLRALSVRTVAVAQICASLLVATLTPVALSTDPFVYVAYGELDQHGANPWNPPPITPDDDSTRIAIEAWGNPIGPSVYGGCSFLLNGCC